MRRVLRGIFDFRSKLFDAGLKNHKVVSSTSKALKCVGYVSGFGISYFIWSTVYNYNTVYALKAKKKEKEDDFSKDLRLTSRERHFISFASVVHDGQIYMTPQDFLESFVEAQPRARHKRRVITNKDLEEIRGKTPPLKKGSTQLFRHLRDKGIISYTEYLFLLSILTKPQTGFRIAFNMFDTDGNKKVDKEEFLVILHLLSSEVAVRSQINDDMRNAMERIFNHAWEDKHGVDKNNLERNVDGQNLKRKNLIDTTLLIHFFGQSGKNVLQYDEFRKFMENLQTEVLEMEFQEFAKGADTISELDFARILLRYTHLDAAVCDAYLDRLLDRLRDRKGIPPGISFNEFKVFCQFLNHLEDFTIAMRMYTLADHPISKEEFHRAVKICTGTSLSRHLVHTVFDIFDEDGDGQLSYTEFIAIMKDRLHRGFKSHLKMDGWEAFKSCVKQGMKSPGR